MSREIQLSIIIPAYNEAQRLPKSIADIKNYMDNQPYSSEVIIVDDGSQDSTPSIVRAWMNHWTALRLVESPHQGKGGAVRSGVLAAQGAWVYLADADFSVPIEDISLFLANPPLEDLRIGSRDAPGAHRYGEPYFRHVMGRVFNRLVQMMAAPGIMDSQCGFKLIRREVARDLCLSQTITGWTFDVELLYIARLRGYSIREIGVPWYYRPGSKVHPIRDTFAMLSDLFTIRRNASNGIYQRRTATHLNAAPDFLNTPVYPVDTERKVISSIEIETTKRPRITRSPNQHDDARH